MYIYHWAEAEDEETGTGSQGDHTSTETEETTGAHDIAMQLKSTAKRQEQRDESTTRS
jgi:hypothetical protein